MKRRPLVCGLAAAWLSSDARAQAQPDAKGTALWRLATGYRAESFHGRNLQQLARDVEAATGAALRIELHANNTLVPLAQIAVAVSEGSKVQAGEVIASAAEARGWAASQEAARESVEELRRQGMRVEPAAAHLAHHLRRLGERFSVEWVREVGAAANDIFIPFYAQSQPR